MCAEAATATPVQPAAAQAEESWPVRAGSGGDHRILQPCSEGGGICWCMRHHAIDRQTSTGSVHEGTPLDRGACLCEQGEANTFDWRLFLSQKGRIPWPSQMSLHIMVWAMAGLHALLLQH